MTITHYLITANHEAIGITASDETHAWQIADEMGVRDIVVRVDKAMTEAEWDAATTARHTTTTPPKPRPPLYRRIGGIHWLALGRIRVSVCLTRPKPPIRFEVFDCTTGDTWTTLPERPARIAAHILSRLTGHQFDYEATGPAPLIAHSAPLSATPRLGWLMLPVAALTIGCTAQPAPYALMITGASGTDYLISEHATKSACMAEIGAWDNETGDVFCVEQSR